MPLTEEINSIRIHIDSGRTIYMAIQLINSHIMSLYHGTYTFPPNSNEFMVTTTEPTHTITNTVVNTAAFCVSSLSSSVEGIVITLQSSLY